MRLTTHVGDEYMVHFFHEPDPRPQGVGQKMSALLRMKRFGGPTGLTRKTIATIHHGPCDAEVRPCINTNTWLGESKCRVDLDPFSPATGRKQALSRAMIGPDPEHPRIPKGVRHELWESYLRKVHPTVQLERDTRADSA